MSSVVRKSTHFAPKVKRQVTRNRRGNENPPQTATQESSQVGSLGTEEEKKSDESTSEGRGSLLSLKPSTETSLTNRNGIAAPEVHSGDVVQSGRKNNNDDDDNKEDDDGDDGSQDGEIYEDNDIFKRPLENSVRQLGISNIRVSTKASPISMTPPGYSSSPSSLAVDDQSTGPLKISIPVNKPSKRRRSSVNLRSQSTKKSAVSLITSAAAIEKDPVLQPESMENLDQSSSSFRGTDFVIGVDQTTNKLKKFRVLKANESSGAKYFEGGKVVPVAPSGLTTRISSAKQLPKKIRDEDLELYANVGVDIEEITMADLCKPSLPIGEVSANYELVKEAQRKQKQKREERRRDRRIARQQRIPLEDIDPARAKGVKTEKSLFDEIEQEPQSTSLKLTMKDGKIGYDEESTVRSRHVNLDNNRSREESNPFENPVTSFSYSKRKHTDRWTSDELKQFYEALSTWGTDFTFIAQLFPYRTRKQIKSKFNLEEKKYPEIIEMALKRKLPPDFEKYCKDSKNKFETLEFYNDELKDIRLRHEEHMELITKERERALQEDAEDNRRREFRLRTGNKPQSREERIRELRKNEMVVGEVGKTE